jgi:hypothetical protein
MQADGVTVRAAVGNNGPEISLGGPDGVWVLRRLEDGPAPAWSLEVVKGEGGGAMTLVGRSGGVVRAICLNVRPDGQWLEVTETLSSEGGPLPAMEAFEARWRFYDGGEVAEVFTPSLVPEDGDLVGQHMFRAPVLVVEGATAGAAVVVDVGTVGKSVALPAALSLLRGSGNEVDLVVGLHAQEVRGHVFHRRQAAAHELAAQTVTYGYCVGVFPSTEPGASLGAARRKAWAMATAGQASRPLAQAARDYARQIYPPVLRSLWAETVIGGRRAGAITSNRSYAGDVWFSSWFNPVRSSYGLYHYGVALGEHDWVEMARATRTLVLSAPAPAGLFPTVFVFGPDRWVESHHQGGGPGIFHVMDMSWTMYQLLRWHAELEPDDETTARARSYARALVGLQRPDGGLPAYVDRDGAPVTVVDRAALLADVEGAGGDPYVPAMLASRWAEGRYVESAEDAASLLFLSTLARLLPAGDAEREVVLGAAREVARYLAEQVVPSARWTDFEVYFSCSPKSLDFYDHRSGQWPQNTLCMHHAAAGFLELYEVSHERTYLGLAGRAMDRLSLYQQVWDPPWLGLYGFGGYGVMNTDGEWNDARQAQFAETHLAFGKVTGEEEHIERAMAAARAAFTTVFLPASAPRYSGWWRSPRGMAAENHGHGGTDQLNGVSGFDWGSGSALATAAHFERQDLPL